MALFAPILFSQSAVAQTPLADTKSVDDFQPSADLDLPSLLRLVRDHAPTLQQSDGRSDVWVVHWETLHIVSR